MDWAVDLVKASEVSEENRVLVQNSGSGWCLNALPVNHFIGILQTAVDPGGGASWTWAGLIQTTNTARDFICFFFLIDLT